MITYVFMLRMIVLNNDLNLLLQTNEGTGTSINYPLGFKTEPDAIPPNNVSTPPKTNIVTNTSETKPLLLGVA